MSTEPKVLPGVEMNDDLLKAITASLDPAEIKAALLAEAEKQGAALDAAAAEKAAAEQAAANAKAVETPQLFTRTVNIGGKDFTLEGETELELERAVANAYSLAYTLQTPEPATTTTEPTPTPEEVAAKAAEEAAAKAELELKFKRGEISAAEYIEQSGAVDSYLASKGISVDRLKAVVETDTETKEAQSWSDATEVFKNGPGADWPGGDKNLHRIGLYIQALGLIDASDKVDALVQAYTAMKAANDVEPVAAAPAVPVVPAPAAPAPVAAAPAVPAPPVVPPASAAATRTAASSSSLWGASSGVGAGASAGATVPKPGDVVAVPADATPEQIMDAWKKAQVAAGKNPDDAFREQYGNRR